jgi:hypothetical protein
MAGQQLYTLDEIGQVKPVSWAEYDQWEQSLDPSERCPLGTKLKADILGSATVTSLFSLVPMGYFGHKPQLFLTLTVGEGIWLTSVYTSHRACLSGHRDIFAKVRKLAMPLPMGQIAELKPLASDLREASTNDSQTELG